MADMPEKLTELVDDLASITDRTERAELLIEMADRFSEVRVPATLATKPYDERHKAPACESDAYVWAVDQPDGTLQYYFDVLNPQGLSAMAMSVILGETVSGQPLEQVVGVHRQRRLRVNHARGKAAQAPAEQFLVDSVPQRT